MFELQPKQTSQTDVDPILAETYRSAVALVAAVEDLRNHSHTVQTKCCLNSPDESSEGGLQQASSYPELKDKGLSPKTVHDIIGTLQTFMNRMYKLELIRRLPLFPMVAVPETFKGWFNAYKQSLVLQQIPERHRLIYRLLIESAERPGEVCAHKVKDLIDGELVIERAFDEKHRLKETKPGKVRFKGLTLALWGDLIKHAQGRLPEAWLFVDEWGQPYSQGRLYDIWVRAVKAAGLPHISLYAGTRHSRASQKRLEMEKRVAEECRKEIGHSDSGTTMKHYARSRREEL